MANIDTQRRSRPGPSKGDSAQRAYDHIRSGILSLSLEPGSNISEAAIVKELDVSRTPVREAIVRLISEGFIEEVPNQGVPRVAPMDLGSVAQILDALELCQRAATRWAALNNTAELMKALDARHAAFVRAAHSMDFERVVEENRAFHSAIGAGCGNAIIANVYDSLLNKSLRIARLIFARKFPHLDPSHRYDVVIAEHQDMLEAIRNGDAARADALGARHAQLFRRSVVSFLSKNQAEDITVTDPVALSLSS